MFKNHVKMSEFEFKAVTKHSGKLKTLFEILFLNLQTAALKIDATGILLEQNTTQNLSIRVFLPASGFDEYHFKVKDENYNVDDETQVNSDKQSFSVGLSNNINKEFFKSVKNKDKITMATSGPFNFVFEKTGNGIVQSLTVTIEDVFILQPDKIEYSNDFITIAPEEFTQMCRSLWVPKLNVTKQDGQVIFAFKTPRSEKKVTCGSKNINDREMIHREYNCEQFNRISKIQSLAGANIEVYYQHENPLKLVVKNELMDFQVIIYEQLENN